MAAGFYDAYATPGISAVRETQEKNFMWDLGQGIPNAWRTSEFFLSSTVDAGNTPTTLLRPGLLLGKITATNKVTHWDPAATDGSEVVYGINQMGMSMLDGSATAIDRYNGYCIVGGPVKMANILVPGASTWGLSGVAKGMLAMAQMRGRFVFDSQLANGGAFLSAPRREITKAANYSVVEADNGTLFYQITGAVTFTLPAVTNAAGLQFEFFNTVDANMTIASAAADGIIVDGDAAASTVAFSTSSHKIGSHARVWFSSILSKWVFTNLGSTAVTLT